ncbi:MAG: PAS domain-containing protein [Methanobacteriota archaeon]
MASNRREPKNEPETDGLRIIAENQLSQSHETIQNTAETSQDKIIHELQVHQIELEIQNQELKRAYQDLESSRDKYIDFYDFSPVGFFTLTKEGLISEVNLIGAALLGVVRRDLINTRFRGFIVPNYYDEWDRYFLHVLKEKEKQICRICVTSDDGILTNIRIEGIRIERGNKEFHVRLVASDISDLKEVERALLESEERFRLLFQDAPIPYQSLDTDGNFLNVNNTWLKMMGYDIHEVLGHWFGDFLPLNQKVLFREQFPFFRKEGVVHGAIFSMQKKDGEIIIVSFEGKNGYNHDASKTALEMTIS